MDCLFFRGLKTKTDRFDQTGGDFDETIVAKEAKNVVWGVEESS